MFSLPMTFLCAAAAASVWTMVGYAAGRRLLPAPLAFPFAPLLGWALHSVVALPLHMGIGMSRAAVAVQMAAALLAALASLRRAEPASFAVPPAAYAVAAAVACLCAAAIVPKAADGGLALSGAIFDHSKIAMVDEMARAGVPPANPFFSETGSPDRLVYYYLWHFSAAELSALTGATGWEADAALTWFTAFASLAAMMGLAVSFSGQPSAAYWVPLLAATASLRTTLAWIFGYGAVSAVLAEPAGFAGWLFQTTWAPQHMMGAGCVVLAATLIVRLGERPRWPGAVALGLVAAAGYQSSVWTGGVTFGLASVPVAAWILIRLPAEGRIRFLLWLTLAAVIAAAFAAPFIIDQVAATARRGGGTPIAIRPFDVLGPAFAPIYRLVNPPAFWLVQLPAEFPAFFVAGVAALAGIIMRAKRDDERRTFAGALALLMLVSLIVSWLFVSVIGGNNDLGWRAVLPAAMLLIAFAAAGIARWFARPGWPAVLASIGVVLGLLDGVLTVGSFLTPIRTTSARPFVESAAMWQAVRRHSGPADRVVNNPLALRDATAWPVNISWALLAGRRSCYAGDELGLAFAAVPTARRGEIDALFVNAFAGKAERQDIAEIATRFGCRVVVVTPQDGAWNTDAFAASGLYLVVEQTPAWRILVRSEQGR